MYRQQRSYQVHHARSGQLWIVRADDEGHACRIVADEEGLTLQHLSAVMYHA